MKKDKAVILANGDYPRAKQPREILECSDFVVCCDGAANMYIEKGCIPSVIIGDGDSLSDDYKELYSDIIIRVSRQDNNDLTKAVDYLADRGVKEIDIVGATGKREDHTLANISLIMNYYKRGMKVRMYTDYGVFIPASNKSSFSSHRGQQISIFNFSAYDISSKGLRYPLYDIKEWWEGTLNEAEGEEFTINAKGDYLLFINY